jgi:hypothetical protein
MSAKPERAASSYPVAHCIVAMAVLLVCVSQAVAQVYRIDSFDPKLTPQPLHPTSIPLSNQRLDGKTHQELIRIMAAEEAFTMRALPLGRHGLVLHANGNVTPDGSDYQHAIQEYGLSAKPGARVQVTDIHIGSDKVVVDLNGGPEKKHHWLQHIQVGGSMGARQLAPDEPDPVGARITLVFPHFVPEMTGQQLKALLSPLLDFSLKSPLEAYADTLPPLIRNAVKEHRVLVGMNREMVLYALSQPDRKVHEAGPDGFDYEEWIYGRPPQDVKFVRFVGDRVTRVEIAAIGKDPVIRQTDETNGYLANKSNVHERTVTEGDQPVDETQRAAPTLRRPGETAPSDQPQPVKMPPASPAPPSGNQFAAL